MYMYVPHSFFKVFCWFGNTDCFPYNVITKLIQIIRHLYFCCLRCRLDPMSVCLHPLKTPQDRLISLGNGIYNPLNFLLSRYELLSELTFLSIVVASSDEPSVNAVNWRNVNYVFWLSVCLWPYFIWYARKKDITGSQRFGEERYWDHKCISCLTKSMDVDFKFFWQSAATDICTLKT